MAIKFEGLSHTYAPEMPYAFVALDNIDFEIEKGSIVTLIGHTGSGKSTLIQHLNALLLPTSGSLNIDDFKIEADTKPKNLKHLRSRVGLVFQFSEYQLFEETILKDVAFGPKNFGFSEEEAIIRAKEALSLVGLDESYYERSPLDLSGGQKRRVAIAGILAIDPEIIILDEPTAGLDPRGAREIIKIFVDLNKEKKKTIIIVCHDNEIVYRYSDYTAILEKGKLKYYGSTKDLFESEKANEFNLVLPDLLNLHKLLNEKGFELKDHYDDLEALVKALKGQLK